MTPHLKKRGVIKTMRIGIVGTGNMGRSLGLLWAERGHEVLFGARDAAKGKAAADLSGGKARSGTNDEAASFGDVVFWNVRGVAPGEVLRQLSVLDGKVIIDTNNGSMPGPGDHSLPAAHRAHSYAEELQAALPRARVVKAFNTIAQEVFELAVDPLRASKVTVFVAGDDDAAKSAVSELASQIGLSPLDSGPLAAARALEGLGDFIRSMMVYRGLGVYAALSIHALPAPERSRLGGRQATNLT